MTERRKPRFWPTCLGFLIAFLTPVAWGIGRYLADHGVLPNSPLSALIPAMVVVLIAFVFVFIGDRR